VLAHLAQWDALALYLLTRWERGDIPPARAWEDEDVEWINNSAKPLCLALTPRAAAQLALEMAEQTDGKIAALPDALLEGFAASNPPVSVSRALHRREHLDEIERALTRT
jgi:hypothetical protein